MCSLPPLSEGGEAVTTERLTVEDCSWPQAMLARNRAESLRWLASQPTDRRTLTVEECYVWAAEADRFASAFDVAEQELERLREALERLASTQGFIGAVSGYQDHILWAELAARGDFAKQALHEQRKGEA